MALNWRNGRFQTGKLRHRIDIVKVSPVQDSTGGINWSIGVLYANVWATVEDLFGDETLGAQAETSVATHQIIMRYIPAAPSWQPDWFYYAGTLVKDEAGYLQQALSDFTSGLVEPDWNEQEGQISEDGNPSLGTGWINLGVAPPYTGVTSAMQVRWQGRQFQVKNVLNPDGKNKMQVLMCVEINDSRQQIPGMNAMPNQSDIVG